MPKPTQLKKRIPIVPGDNAHHIMTDMVVKRTDNTTRIELYIEGPLAEVVAGAASECDFIALTFTNKTG